ncbi:hypothetical protein BDV11DRAFT_195049, partial [Aspergillus similis]
MPSDSVRKNLVYGNGREGLYLFSQLHVTPASLFAPKIAQGSSFAPYFLVTIALLFVPNIAHKSFTVALSVIVQYRQLYSGFRVWAWS